MKAQRPSVLFRFKLLTALVLGFCFFPSDSCGAVEKLDSLHRALRSAEKAQKGVIYFQLSQDWKGIFSDSALFYANEALRIGRQQQDLLLSARALAQLGEIKQLQSDFQQSIDYYFEAIKLAEEIDHQKLLGSFYNGLGISFFYINDLEKAEYYIGKAADHKLAIGDHTYYSILTTNLANIFFYNGKYDEAITLLKNAESVLIEKNQGYYLSSLYNSLGGVYQQGLNDLNTAKYYYEKSLRIAIEDDILQNIISGYHNLAILQMLLNNNKEAIENLNKAKVYALKSDNIVFVTEVYKTLSEVHEKAGDYKNAFLYKSLQMQYKDSIFKSDKQKAVEELEFKFQNTKKQQQIQLQQQEIQEAKLVAEQQKNRIYLIVLIASILLLLSLFFIFYVIQKRKTVQLLEREKSKIFENIVHEIRTPLTLINGPLQLVKEKLSKDSSMHENIQMIEHNSEKLVRLVNELLDVSKLDKGQYALTYQVGDVGLFVNSIIQGFSAEIKQKNLELVWEIPSQKYILRFATNAYEKIISNLLENAIKYAPEGSTIRVTLRRESEYALFAVSDEGFGIPEKEKEKIFQRFYRLGIHESFKGTGIGLSIVKELVELLKGEISLKSEQNVGTTFEVRIPFESIKDVAPETEISDNKPVLLIVDDEEDILKFVGEVLKYDFNIVTAKNGEEALKKMMDVLPDLLLSDVMMPIKDGLQLITEVKSNPLTNHIPVILFSSKSSLESRMKGLSVGADGYLPKPFYPDELKLLTKNIYQTIKNAQQEFLEELKSDKPFEERIMTNSEYVNKGIQFVLNNISNEDYSVNELAADMCISRSQLHRKLTAQTGLSATNFIKMVRMEKAKDLLKENWGNVTEIAYECGFNSQSYFTKSFTEYFGVSPTKFLKN
ncbi:MAG: response regulator [Crocinitomicaceae bacterium]|nr:response regulator [Crocinitomicaceae bacterium]